MAGRRPAPQGSKASIGRGGAGLRPAFSGLQIRSRFRNIEIGRSETCPTGAGAARMFIYRLGAESGLQESRSAGGAARGGYRVAHDARRKSPANAGRIQRARRAGVAGDSAAGHSRLRLLERSAARRGSRGRGDGVSAGYRPGGELGHGHDASRGGYDFHGGSREVQPGDARQRPQPLSRADVLVAEHQHLSRSALGPRAGNLRRRSVSYRAHGCGLHQRHAGRRSALLQSDRDRQAFRGTQRAGVHPASGGRQGQYPRFGGDLSAGVPRGRRGRQSGFGDVRL